MPLRFRPVLGALLLTAGTLLLGATPVQGQERAVVRAEENFRREPNGVVLARLAAGTALRVLGTQGNWTQVETEGWVWLRSLQVSDDASFDLVVSADGGENLRSGPSGTILGRLEEGVLLEELGRNEGWARVSRLGWVWSASLDAAPVMGEPTQAAEQGAPRPSGPASRAPGGVLRSGGGPILTAPDGDTLAVIAPASDVEVLRRDGNWIRVRLEGWMWMPGRDEAAPAEEAGPSAVDPADLIADPEAFAGRVVAWTIQYISLERASAVRTDFFEGEPFLLSRFGGADGPYVYVAVPTDRLDEVEGLFPLERVDVTGRIRTGASSLTGVPIIDLISIQRAREDP
jgi:hypothetical protein